MSDWSSDVCSSDLKKVSHHRVIQAQLTVGARVRKCDRRNGLTKRLDQNVVDARRADCYRFRSALRIVDGGYRPK